VTQELKRFFNDARIREMRTHDPESDQLSYELVDHLVDAYPRIEAVQVRPDAGGPVLLLMSLEAGMYTTDEAWAEERQIQYEDLVRSYESDEFRLYFIRPEGVIARWPFGPTDEPPNDDPQNRSSGDDSQLREWLAFEAGWTRQGVDIQAAVDEEFYRCLANSRYVFRRRWPTLEETIAALAEVLVEARRMGTSPWWGLRRQADDFGYELDLDRALIETFGASITISFPPGCLRPSD
jgi:hypothetical protein